MEISPVVATFLLFGSLLAILVTGLPVCFVIGGVATLFSIIFFGFQDTQGLFLLTFASFTNEILLAVPLFLLMASVLQYSGIADDAYDMFYKWMGGLNGGLAMGTVLICTIFAAVTGISGTATVSMGLIALPSMLKRGYNKHLATGAIAAGGVLGILIPPSILMIIYGLLAHVSVGKLFMGGVIPGLILASLYISYIGIRCWRNQKLGPSIPLEERAAWGEKMRTLRAVVLPILLILIVLGSIYLGVATPTEAAAIGAFGAYICAVVHRRLNWTLVRGTSLQTLKLTAMCFWIVAGAMIFGGLYTHMGARTMIETLTTGLAVNPWFIVIGMQLSLFILGCVMDDFAIVMITAPIYVPIIKLLGFDPLWFGILFVINMNIAYLTPPYGFNLFYLIGLAPYVKEQTGVNITMGDIYRSVVPFIGLQIIGLSIVMAFPIIATWLPNTMW